MNHSDIPTSKIILFGEGVGIANVLSLLLHEPGMRVCAVVPRLNKNTGKAENSDLFVKLASDNKIPVLNSPNINSDFFLKSILDFSPNLLVNWGHGQVFKEKLRTVTVSGVLNLHPGLLPAGRGSGAVVGEIWNGKKTIGMVAHIMDEHIDRGRIIMSRSLEITGYEYQDEINKCVMEGAAEFLLEAIKLVLTGTKGEAVNGFGRYYPKLANGDDIIDWSLTSDFLVRRIRSRSPVILSRTFKNSDKSEIFIRRASLSDVQPYFSPVGQVLDRQEGLGILVKTGDTAIWIEEISLDKSHFFVPKFPIGTTFLSNWLNEFVGLNRQISALRHDLEELKNTLLSAKLT